MANAFWGVSGRIPIYHRRCLVRSPSRSFWADTIAAGVLILMVLAIGLGVRYVENGQPPLNRNIRCVAMEPDSINGGYVAQVVSPDGRAFRVLLDRVMTLSDIPGRDIIYLMQSGTDGSYCAYVSPEFRP